jgi:zinc/manganese transport system substrate-binding protein
MLPVMRMILKSYRGVLLLAVFSLVVAACSSTSQADAEGVRVVATTTMLGDIARNVVGDGGSVQVLLPIGADPHEFQPSSAQVSSIYGADLVLANGLGLEDGLSDVLDAASADGVNVIEVAGLVDPVTFVDRQPCNSAAARYCDPHVWLDPERDVLTALLIGEALALTDTSVDWGTRADEYAAEISESDGVITEILSVVAGSERILVTNHDSLGYFADRYGFEVVGSVIPGGSTLSEPSSADIAALVDVINKTGAVAIFAETTEPTVLADAIASEVDHAVQVILLFTGSLGPQGSGADTLIGMLETNATRVADGLS